MQGKVLEAKAETAVYVGIDTSKAWLDVYLQPSGQSLRVANTKDGVRQLRRELTGKGVVLVVIEATGKLHRLAHRMLSQAGFPVAVVNPYRSRKLADALGQLAGIGAGPASVHDRRDGARQPSEGGRMPGAENNPQAPDRQRWP
jgi:transposase